MSTLGSNFIYMSSFMSSCLILAATRNFLCFQGATELQAEFILQNYLFEINIDKQRWILYTIFEKRNTNNTITRNIDSVNSYYNKLKGALL